MAGQPDFNDRWPEEDSDDESVSPVEGRSFFSTWGWPLFGLAAFVIFELTTSPLWSSLVFALRFGWKDTYTAWFLWQVDPVIPRGRALGLLHLAAGMSRVFWVSLALMCVFVVYTSKQVPAGAQIIEEIAKLMMLVFFLGSIGCGTLTLIVAWISWRHQLKLWVDSNGYHAAIHGDWPPQEHHRNRCRELCWHAMAPLTVLYMAIIFVAFVMLESLVGKRDWVGMLMAFAVPVGAALLYLFGLQQLDQLISAKHPEDCWPELANRPCIEES
jgi:hypothetical protein